MFGEDVKSLAGDLANYNWKIFACSVVFDNIFTNGRCDWACLLRAPVVPSYKLVPRLLISFRFEESKTKKCHPIPNQTRLFLMLKVFFTRQATPSAMW